MFQAIASRVRAFLDGADARAPRMRAMALRTGADLDAPLDRPGGAGEAFAGGLAAAARTCAFCGEGDACAATLADARDPSPYPGCPNLPFFRQAARDGGSSPA
jgi:hypothetical protein